MFRFIQSLIENFADLLFPALCLGCNQSIEKSNTILCVSCRMNLPETNQHQEPYDRTLLNKFAGKVPVQFLASYLYFKKGGIVQKLIHQIKFNGKKEAAKELAGWYGYQLKQECSLFQEIDLILGVPLYKSRQQQRGYNQADWIAEGFSETLEIPTQTGVLVRNYFNSSQTNKNRLERWENVKTVFSVAQPEAVKGRHILIVDDVLTTGATIEACIVELLKAECTTVSVLTLAVAGR